MSIFLHECENTLRVSFAEKGIDVTVSTVPPLVAGPYTTDGMTCPHGIAYWWEPTGEQIALWAKDGTE